MDEEEHSNSQEICTMQERNCIQQMDEEECSISWAICTMQEHNHIQQMHEEKRSKSWAIHTVQERNCIQQMDEEAHAAYNQQHAVNQRNYVYPPSNPGDEDYLAYCVACDVQCPLEDHPFVKLNQQKFHNDMNKYEMCHCIMYKECWLMTIKNCVPSTTP